MDSGSYSAVTGAILQEKRLEILTNNLANVNTSGYKEDMPVFEEYMATADSDIIFPTFTEVRTNFDQGQLVKTGNTLDLCISGKGFFKVETPDGIRYTRAGNFVIDKMGRLVSPDGYTILGEGGQITLQGGSVTVDSDGTIWNEGTQVDRLSIVDFDNYKDMKKTGENLYQYAGDGTESRSKDFGILQGYLESSNVDVVQTMVSLIEVNRAYESYQKVIASMDPVNSQLNNQVGRV